MPTSTTTSTNHTRHRSTAARLWRSAVHTLGVAPISIVTSIAALTGHKRWATDTQTRLANRITASDSPSDAPVPTPTSRTLGASLIGVPLGLVAWVLALLAGPNTVRNVFLYGLTDGGGTQNAWGGPTLAGAWTLHAALALLLLPVELGLIAAIGSIHAQLTDSDRRVWVLPAALVVATAGILFAWALIRQL